MLFGCKNDNRFSIANQTINQTANQTTIKRKETLSPVKEKGFNALPPISEESGRRRASFFAPLRGSLTAETALVLPLFFLCMIGLLHFGSVMGTAARFGSALSETSERMAVNAYAIENGSANPFVYGSMSALYARGKVMGKAGDTSAVRSVSFLLSSFQEEDEMIKLVMIYRAKPLVSAVNPSFLFFIQQGCVRAWTGRKGSGGDGGGGENDAGEEGRRVYVAEHGSVYHTDENCTHIRLSIRTVQRENLGTMRNTHGERYSACERCGSRAGSSVYITSDGNRYHSTLHCSGLRRTVNAVPMEETDGLRPCSRCAKG